MSYKLICPHCDTYTSSVFHAYEEGLPCPHCGVPLTDSDGRTARSYYAQLGTPIAESRQCWCGGEIGLREPGDANGMGCLENIMHARQSDGGGQ